MGEQPLENRIKSATLARGDHRLADLVQDLVFPDDDRVSSHRYRDRVTDDGLIDEVSASVRDRRVVGGRVVADDPVCLDTVAGLKDETGATGGPFAGADTEALALDGRHVPSVCDERDDAPELGCHQLTRRRPAHRPTGRPVYARDALRPIGHGGQSSWL